VLAAVPIERESRAMNSSSIRIPKALHSSITLVALSLILGGASAVSPVAYRMAQSDNYLASLQSASWRTFDTPGRYEPSTLKFRPIMRNRWARNMYSQAPVLSSGAHHKPRHHDERRENLGKLLAGVALAHAVVNQGNVDALSGR
jgi:hypothetical protein